MVFPKKWKNTRAQTWPLTKCKKWSMNFCSYCEKKQFKVLFTFKEKIPQSFLSVSGQNTVLYLLILLSISSWSFNWDKNPFLWKRCKEEFYKILKSQGFSNSFRLWLSASFTRWNSFIESKFSSTSKSLLLYCDVDSWWPFSFNHLSTNNWFRAMTIRNSVKISKERTHGKNNFINFIR